VEAGAARVLPQDVHHITGTAGSLSTLTQGHHHQASEGQKKTEWNEEPCVPPGEGCPPHPLEDAKPPEVAHDPTEEDGHESPRPCDKYPPRQGGAPRPESAQHDETR